MSRSLQVPACAALVVACTSCASIFDGHSDPVTFTSQPPGATVEAGDQRGVTPTTLDLPKSTTEVTFTFPGREPRKLELNRSFQAGFLVMDLLFTPGFGLSGILIDAGTGAWWKLDPSLHCDLDAAPAVTALN